MAMTISSPAWGATARVGASSRARCGGMQPNVAFAALRRRAALRGAALTRRRGTPRPARAEIAPEAPPLEAMLAARPTVPGQDVQGCVLDVAGQQASPPPPLPPGQPHLHFRRPGGGII